MNAKMKPVKKSAKKSATKVAAPVTIKPSIENAPKAAASVAPKAVVAKETKPTTPAPAAVKPAIVSALKAASAVLTKETKSVAVKEVKPAVTTIEARIDVGFGNNVSVRGQGAGLSWDNGTPLTCVDGKTWRWTTPATEKLVFKLLLNDNVWAQGEDLVAAPGQKLTVTPQF